MQIPYTVLRLDPYVGFMHDGDRPGRISLAPRSDGGTAPDHGRPIYSDTNQHKKRRASHFETQQDHAVYLNEEGRKSFNAWQNRKRRRSPILSERKDGVG